MECLRGQGMPEEWHPILSSINRTYAYNLIGNAVSTPVAKALAEHLIKIDEAKAKGVARPIGLNSDDINQYRHASKKEKTAKLHAEFDSGLVKFEP